MPALGGTTTLVYNERSGKVETSYLSLAGTSRNCAGGMTPWNSWITCEETTYLKGDEAEKDHGWLALEAIAGEGFAGRGDELAVALLREVEPEQGVQRLRAEALAHHLFAEIEYGGGHRPARARSRRRDPA